VASEAVSNLVIGEIQSWCGEGNIGNRAGVNRRGGRASVTDIFMGHVTSGLSGLRTIKQLIVWAGGYGTKRGKGWTNGGGFYLEAGVRTEVSADKETARDEKDERVAGGTNGGRERFSNLIGAFVRQNPH
jgi:hypothetical protein